MNISHYPAESLTIRKYHKTDREAIRRICCDTAFMGEPTEKFFDDRQILADILTSYYTDFEPDLTFVAELNKQIVGYLTGGRSLKKQRMIFMTKIIPKTCLKFFLKGLVFKPKTRNFCLNCFKSLLKGEFRHPDFSRDYPASLHINIDYKFRNLGIGRELIEKYVERLKQERIRGILVTTTSQKAKEFFRKMGFTVLYYRRISYYTYLNCENLFFIILGKKLN